MIPTSSADDGRFVWFDLATTDAPLAASFYEKVFDWVPHIHEVDTGHFTRLQRGGRDIGSLYQLGRHHLSHGVPSHWTPYVAVASADTTAADVAASGGRIVVTPFEVPGFARIAVASDPTGALFGLWQQSGPQDNATPLGGARGQEG